MDGLYFITICCIDRTCLFGEIINRKMELNDFGVIADNEWLKSAKIRSEIEIDHYVILPNHIHGIVVIRRGDRLVAPDPNVHHFFHDMGDQPVAPTVNNDNLKIRGPKQKSIGALVAGYKSSVTKQINILRYSTGSPVWQRNYYEHIIRNETAYERISEYIISNPERWECDKFFRE
jgi:REP element-mobilizing transposase RayT